MTSQQIIDKLIQIELWYLRNFRVIDKEEAIKLNLIHKYNIYGDLINNLNCRSIWVDYKNRFYRVNQLI